MIRSYQESDFPEIKSWGEGWGSNYEKEYFPPTGVIIPGVAAFFLYETPSKVCFLENLVSNPKADKELVREALDLIVPALFSEARRRGFEVAYASTNNPQVVERAIRLGSSFEAKYVLLRKKL